MGTSKILIDGVGIDLTQDTVAANKMLSGIKAHDSNGDAVTGNIPIYTGASEIKTSVVDAADATAAEVDIISGKTAYAGSGKIIGTLKMKMWTVTVPVLTYSATLVANDPVLLQHRNDQTAYVYARATSRVTSNTVSEVFFNGNFDLSYNLGGNVFGCVARRGSSSLYFYEIGTPLNTQNNPANGTVYIDETGSLIFSANGNNRLANTTYLIVFGW